MPLTFELKVVPSSGRSGFVRDKSGMIKCYLKNPPEDGKANRELITLIATTLRIAQQDVSIIQGLTSRRKRIKIDKLLTLVQLYRYLEIEDGNQSFIAE